MTDLSPEQAQEIVQQGIEREVRKLLRVMLFKIKNQLLAKQWHTTYVNHGMNVVSIADIEDVFKEYKKNITDENEQRTT